MLQQHNNFRRPKMAASRQSFALNPCVMTLVMAGLLTAPAAWAQSLPAGTLPVPAAKFVQQGNASASFQVSGKQATVTTQGPATILNWKSLDLAKDSSLRFQMANSTDRVLNKVEGGAINNRTTIEGLLQSNGQVYIYNPNGVLFGKNATVDVNALVATSLKIDDQRFMDGLLSPSVAAAMQMDDSLGHLPGAVVVEGDSNGGTLQRAAISAAKNGFILLAAPKVENRGELKAPDGQVVLAAGTRVFLAAPSNPAMRGLLVEVGSQDLEQLAAQAASFMPMASNSGRIEVQHGNATLVGRMVNQDGLISASTSVNLNGSIYLKAQDQAVKTSAESSAQAQRGGDLVLGAESKTLITPDLDDQATASRATAFKVSQVLLSGQTVVAEGGALVRAAGGQVDLFAKANPSGTASQANSSRVELKAGSMIDVSGSSGVQKSMESNVIDVELRGGELADNLLLRDKSGIRGQTVQIDSRKGASVAIANVQGYLDQVGLTVGEFTASGGKVQISSEGEVALQAGSKVDVSGGWVDVQGGHVNTSKLTLGGKLYDIETARADLPYDGLVKLENNSANYEAGYREGKSAGSIQINSSEMTLSGELAGRVNPGQRQRDLSASDMPQGGQLALNLRDNGVAGAAQTAVYLGKGEQTGLLLDLEHLVNKNGLRTVSVSAPGDLFWQSELVLPAMTRLALTASGDIQLYGGFSSAGGSLSLATALGKISVANGSWFDLAGRWQNDMPQSGLKLNPDGLSESAYAIHGGSLSLNANHVLIGNGVTIDVSGGAWLNAAGKQSAGNAGSISLVARPVLTSLDAQLVLGPGLQLSGYGLKQGGSLSLTGRNVWLGLSPLSGLGTQYLAQGDLVLPSEFVGQGGFSKLSLTANGNLQVMPDSDLRMQPKSWQLLPDASLIGSGPMGLSAWIVRLPLSSLSMLTRSSSSLGLRASSLETDSRDLGRLLIGAGARISLDPGSDTSKPSSLTLAANRQVSVQGEINVPAGQVNLLLTPDSSVNYDAQRQILVGSGASIDVSGSTERLTVETNDVVVSGDVLSGGKIQIGRLNGSQLEAAVGTVRIEQGSLLDVSGAATEKAVRLNALGQISESKTLASAAGSIDIRAREGLWLAGRLEGQAGSDRAQGASLSVSLDRENLVGSGYPAQDRILHLSKTLSGQAPADNGGQGYLQTAGLADAGFTNVQFKSQNKIELEDGLEIKVGSTLRLDTPTLAAAEGASSATLSAPYVSLGNADPRYQDLASAATDGQTKLTVKSDNLDLVGRSSTQGFGQVQLKVKQDIRLVGISPSDVTAGGAMQQIGQFATGKDLKLESAQVYPSTLSQFEIALDGAQQASKLTLAASGAQAGPVPSAAGHLTLKADRIEQGGRLLAPQGQISLLANDSLLFKSGSLTSVAGSEVVLFGKVTNGSDWTYTLANGQELKLTTSLAPNTAQGEIRLSEKTIRVQAAKVQQESGSTLDLSGGGKILSYEFAPGPGGSSDILMSSFAVLPGFSAAIAPLDVQEGNAGLRIGDQVYLSGVTGLLAGYYTLLPGHYALLPGGFALQAQSGLRDMSAAGNSMNADGSYTVSGYRVSSTDGRGDTRSSAFRLLSSDLVRKSSEIKLYDASEFLAAESQRTGVPDPMLPADAGRLILQAQDQLSLKGQTRLAATAGQRGSVDIEAPLIEVVADAGAQTAGKLKLLADELTALGAESLLIGGERRIEADGLHLKVSSDLVQVDNNAAHALKAPEIILAARDAVALGPQAKIVASGTLSHAVQSLTVDAVEGSRDGALLLASAARGLNVQRSAGGQGQAGLLELAAGANIEADGTLWLDATKTMRLDNQLKLAEGSTLGVSAPVIRLGSGGQDGDAQFQGSNLTALNRLSSLELDSYDHLDINGAVTLGNGRLEQLGISTKRIVGDQGNWQINAGQVTLSGQDVAAQDTAIFAPSGGQMVVRSDKLLLGQGRVEIDGFDAVTLKAGQDLLASASSGELVVNGALNVDSARLVTRDGANQKLVASGQLALKGSGQSAVANTAGLGGSWSIEGREVNIDTQVLAPSGSIEVRADNGVTLGTGQLSVRGVIQDYGSGHAYTPAGSILLDGGSGKVVLGEAALLDLSATGADAGRLQVVAKGSDSSEFVLKGRLLGAATVADDSGLNQSPRQGGFALDVGRIADSAAFDSLNDALNKAGMTDSREIRLRSGDLKLGENGLMRAHMVNLSVDDGDLTVAGTIDASGDKGGRIELYAAQAEAQGKRGRVVLAGSGRLQAQASQAANSAAGSTGDGGHVILAAANAGGEAVQAVNQGASVWLEQGSRIDVSGAGLGQDGSVLLRAMRTSDGKEVAIASLDGRILGGNTQIEAIKVYQASRISEQADSPTNLDASSDGRMYRDAQLLSQSGSKVLARLGADAGSVALTPGVEVRSSGDLTVSVNELADAQSERGWNLNEWRFGGQAGTLTLRADGKLNIKGSISDGFVKQAGLAMSDWKLDKDSKSWSLRLIAGADAKAANPMQTVASTVGGDVTLGFAQQPTEELKPLALLRTGTGSIDIAAGRDLRLEHNTLANADGDSTLDQQFGAAVYTAGRAIDVDGTAFKSPADANFATDGGAVRITAGRDVVGAPVPQLVNNWLFRQGRSQLAADGVNQVFESVTVGDQTRQLNTAWWIRTDQLGTGVATLAGGDLSVQAGGSVKDLIASVATNAYLPSASNGQVNPNLLKEQGGGDLRVQAGQDILGGQFYVQKGKALLRAERNVGAGSLKSLDLMAPEQLDAQGDAVSVYSPMLPVVALGDASLDLTAGRNLGLEAVYNPTLARQSVLNVDGRVDPNSGFLSQVTTATNAYRATYSQYSAFSTYGPDSAVRLTALGGDLRLSNNGLLLANTSSMLPSSDASGQLLNPMYAYAPARLKAASLSGNVMVDEGMGLAPTADGQLELLAKDSVRLSSYGPLYSGIVMLDQDPATVSQPGAPGLFNRSDVNLLQGKRANSLDAHMPGQLHAGDSEPVRVVALGGDVSMESPPTSDQALPTAALTLPKQAEILAGRDVSNLGFAIQHNSTDDQSLIVAGRNFVDSTDPDKENPVKHVVTGAGLLSLVAGRDIDLGNSRGVVTRGSLDNAYLPEGGAAISALAGASRPDTDESLSPAKLEARSKGFMTALTEAAKEDTLTHFDELIEQRYQPATVSYGDIKVYGSQFKTEQGGAIDLATPNGSVIAGLVSIPFYLQSKPASENGIFTVRGGDIRVMVGQDFIVNQGRVFTLGGGDVTMVSQYGNIDAGRGSKTASSAPPPLLTTDASGNTKIDISGSISGSGIATLRTLPEQKPSSVYAVAPRGIFDAGDAGVRATGTVEIKAETVLNANNISAAAGVSGAVSVDAAPPSSAPSSNSSSTQAQDLAKPAGGSAADNLTLTVEVVGYGDEEDEEEKKKKAKARQETKS